MSALAKRRAAAVRNAITLARIGLPGVVGRHTTDDLAHYSVLKHMLDGKCVMANRDRFEIDHANVLETAESLLVIVGERDAPEERRRQSRMAVAELMLNGVGSVEDVTMGMIKKVHREVFGHTDYAPRAVIGGRPYATHRLRLPR